MLKRHIWPWLHVICLLINLIRFCNAVCEIETGESVAILDIFESYGNQVNQSTTPSELPIRGDLSQIILNIQSSTHNYFKLEGKSLRLTKPLDRDAEGFSSIYLQVSCQEKATGLKRSVPVLVKVLDINDNPPIFQSPSYTTSVSELAPVGTTIFRDLVATDKDAGSNSLIEYFTVPGNKKDDDGYNYFAINLPHQGLVTVSKPLDYEKTQVYYLTIQAVDKASNPLERLTATTTLTIMVEDGDDLDPAFLYPGCTLVKNSCVNAEYKAEVTSGTLAGVLNVQPEAIQAWDRDSLNATIRYSFVNGTPSFYLDHFKIDPVTGVVVQTKIVDRSQAKRFEIIVKAEQVSENRRYATSKLTIDVLAVDNNPPIVTPVSPEGYVDENAPIGTTVVTSRGGHQPLRLMVTDADFAPDDPPPTYTFELTASSFRVNADGIVVVNEANLDRDPPSPSRYTFQVIARQVGAPPGKGASAPVSLSVYLNDVNDNSPRLPSFSPIRIQAGDGTRPLTQVQARDNDDGEFARITYSIYHVSNNGRDKFVINSETGDIDVVGKLTAGEQFSITVQATDAGGRFTQGILDVIVVPGENTGGPMFPKDSYEVQVSEGASINSAVITLTAEDPEKDEVYYSITEGNINDDFGIGRKSGTITVAKRLDREEVSSYTLVIKAEDKSGLFNTATVSITVTDINDQNPQFLQDNYTFQVDEGVVNALVGTVQARDADIGENGEVTYSLSGNSDFDINPQSGQIFTRRALDYERQQTHLLVVTAQDSAPDTRIATASVTVLVNDVQDEKPIFDQMEYEATVPENAANFEIIQVRATDPDTISSITYVIKDGNTALFAIDPITGIVRTVRGLDYERQNTYELVIGTLENDTPDPRATCSLLVIVQDLNDVPPVFTSVPLPIRLQDTVPLGTIVTTVVASDFDGTAPGNQVHYEISGKDKAPFFFLIDGNTGVISVKDDLRKEPDSEYRIEVKARDQGDPPLTATATLTVYVEHIATVPPDLGLGFPDSGYTVEVEENSLANTLVKVLPVINKPRGQFPIGCEITSGNEKGHFYVTENDSKDCELRTQDHQLDFEKQSKFMLTVKLNTVGGIFGSSRLMTQVTVNVIDVNDNRPVFLVPPLYSHLTDHRYLAAISQLAPSDTRFVKVTAVDADSGPNGMITYSILPETDIDGRFEIDPQAGYIRNRKSLEDISPSQLPIRLRIEARDNPVHPSLTLTQTVEVVVNVISDENRLALVVPETPAGKMQEMQEQLLVLLQEKTSMIPGWEKAESLKILKNNSIETDISGSDIWFHLIEPGTLKVLPVDDPRIQSSLLEAASQASLLSAISQTLGIQAAQVRRPFVIVQKSGGFVPVKVAADVGDLGASLIALACIILLLGLVGIIYHCIMWSRFVAHKERVKRLCVAPKYEPAYVEPSLKEYETQVLQMSVPQDEEIGFSDGNFSLGILRRLDSVSYLTRDGREESSPEASGSSLGNAPTARADSTLSLSRTLGHQDDLAPTQNPLFDAEYQVDTDSDLIPSSRTLNHQNSVGGSLFPKNFYSYETTTEL